MKIAEAIAEGGLEDITITAGSVTASVNMDDDVLTKVTGTVEKHVTEYERRTCSHSGNCPCAGRDVTLTSDVICWSDDSCSLEDDTDVFGDDEEALDEVLIQRDIDNQDGY